MGRPHNREVTAIERRHLDDAEALGRDNHRGIHRPEWQVAVVGHRLRNDQWPAVSLQEVEALGVVDVIAIDVRVQRPCVDDQRDAATSLVRISSMRSEMSAWPLAPAPAAKRRREALPRRQPSGRGARTLVDERVPG